jgi:hypothetical protein
MLEYPWTFDPMKKFIWIYFMLACRYEPRAIKYLIKSTYFDPSIIYERDKYGTSILLHAIVNDNLDISILKNFLTKITRMVENRKLN